MKLYKRVSYETRCQIITLLQTNFSIPEIATHLGHHKSTIYRELRRNRDFSNNYTVSDAQNKAQERYKRCRRPYAVKPELKPIIYDKLLKGWSPEQISGRLRREKIECPTHQTLYAFIRRAGYKHCLRRNGKRGAGRYRQREKYKKLPNIALRPKIANERRRIGDWERDTMHTFKGVHLLVCTDRKSRFTKIEKINKRTTMNVGKITKKLIEETGLKAKTMTNDNGSDFKGVSDLKIKTYFCDPYTPGQRGTVENTIGLIREKVKRKSDMRRKNKDYFIDLENWLNKRPRKVLDYQTPYEVYFKKKVALAI